jgi:hypothetical protein
MRIILIRLVAKKAIATLLLSWPWPVTCKSHPLGNFLNVIGQNRSHGSPRIPTFNSRAGVARHLRLSAQRLKISNWNSDPVVLCRLVVFYNKGYFQWFAFSMLHASILCHSSLFVVILIYMFSGFDLLFYVVWCYAYFSCFYHETCKPLQHVASDSVQF